jgi:hypothetical protein
MEKDTKKYLTELHTRLTKFTNACRDDMHEPDEQNVSAHVVGYSLDNAFGDGILPRAIEEGWQEFVVVLKKDGGLATERFNLATLIALARQAKPELF